MRRWLFVLCFGLALPLWLLGCTNTSKGISPDPTQIHYPIGIAVHPSGKFLYVVNANFDLAFTGGTVTVLSTDEDKTATFDIQGVKTELKTLTLLTEATVQIGSFSGQIVINKEGTKAFVAVRQDKRSESPIDVSSITTIALDTSKSGAGHLACNALPVANEDTGGVGEEDKFDNPAPPRCGDASKVFLDDNPFPYSLTLLGQCSATRTCAKDDECTCSAADKAAGNCTADQRCDLGKCVDACTQDSDCAPQGSCAVDRCQRPDTTPQTCNTSSDCAGGETCVSSKLYASHLQTGGLSELSIQEKTATRVLSGISILPSGVTSLAILPALTPLGGAGDIFLSSNQDSNLYLLPSRLPLANDDELIKVAVDHASTATASTQTTVADLRGVVVGHDRKNNRVRLYVAVRNPSPAILVYHLTRFEGKISPQLITYIPVGAGPAQVIYRSQPAPAPDLLYVVCSNEGRVDVIDVETLQTIHQIKVGAQPYFMTTYEPKAGAEIDRRRAYVANFLDSTISIINLDTHTVIGMVKGIDTRPPLQ